jgi:hypothetical protein
MRQHTQNLFKIDNLNSLDFTYRLIEIDLSTDLGDSAIYNTALQKVRMKVASTIGGPAAIVKRQDKHYIAIPSNFKFETAKIKTPPLTVTASQMNEEYKVDLSAPSNETHDIVQKFLDWAIRQQLTDTHGLWSLNTYQFFMKNPLQGFGSQNVDVFGGFKYKLERLQDGNYYVVLDLSYKYLDKYYLPQYINAANKDVVWKNLRGRKCLYQNGDDWYNVEIVGFGKVINEHPVPSEEDPRTVIQYIKARNRNHRFKTDALIDPNHLALLYKYPGRTMEPHHGATSLAKLVYTNSDEEAKSLHKGSIKIPEKKFEYIQSNVDRFFQSLKFNGKPLNVSKTPVTESEKYFPLPNLKFNNGKILSVSGPGNADSTKLTDFGKERKNLITTNGILSQKGFDSQYLIVPDKMEKELVNAFQKHAESYLKKLTPQFKGFKLITYKAEPNLAATIQVQKLDTRLREVGAIDGYALFILPDFQKQNSRMVSNFHDCLKSKFYPDLKFQCASAHKISSYYQSTVSTNAPRLHEYKIVPALEGKYRSYLFNLVSEYLLVNKKWPYALEANGNFDIYIGIDVHERFAGFTLFYKNGEHIFFDYEKVPKKNAANRSEKLKKELIVKKLLPKLIAHIPKYASNPNGIVIIRDGRSFGEESDALKEIIEKLSEQNLVTPDVKWAVVDLHKTSAIPFRIGAVNNGYQKLENPRAGSYKLFNDNEGFLFNTGFPFIIPGTAKPLHLVMPAGTADFKLIMQDIFHQSMLAFSAPDRSNSLPITIKLIDSFLEPLALSDEDEMVEDEELEEEYSPDNKS